MPFTARFAAIAAVMLVGAHAATVGGTVLDSYTRQPVAYAEVALPDYGINLLTDSTGRFVTEVPDADQHVRFPISASRVGYTPRRWENATVGTSLRLYMAPEHVVLEGVTVSAFRIPVPEGQSGPVSIVTGSDLAEHGAPSLSGALGSAPSVFLMDYGNLSTIGMRGATGEQTLVLLDGIPLGTSQDNLVELTNLPQTIAGRVEMVRGGSSALYGANSVGGIAAIITPDPESLTARVTGGLGSFGRRYLRVRQTSRSGPLGLYLAGNIDRDDGRFAWRDSSDSLRIRKNADISSRGVIGKGTLQRGPHQGTLLFELNAGSRGVPGPVSWPSDSARMEDARLVAQAHYSWQQSDVGNLDAALYHHRFWRNYRNPDPVFPLNDTHATTVTGGTALERWHFAPWGLVLASADVADERLASTSIGQPRRTSVGFTVEASLEWRGLAVTPATRFDFARESRPLTDSTRFNATRRVVSPRVWMSYEISRSFIAYAGYNRSYRAPTFNELYWPEDPWTGGNPRLRPEKGNGIDLGLTGRPFDWLWCRAGGFENRLADLILWQPDTAYVFRPANVDSAVITGAELELNLQTKYAGLRSSASWLAARSHGKDLIYRPRLTLDARPEVEWRFVRLSCDVQYAGKRYTATDNTDSLPAYLILDVELGCSPRFGSIKTALRGGCRNLFDRRHESMKGYPLPGRSLYVETELGI